MAPLGIIPLKLARNPSSKTMGWVTTSTETQKTKRSSNDLEQDNFWHVSLAKKTSF